MLAVTCHPSLSVSPTDDVVPSALSEIVVMDIPKQVEHISYTGIEEVKDGAFFSGKYESGMIVMNYPHIE